MYVGFVPPQECPTFLTVLSGRSADQLEGIMTLREGFFDRRESSAEAPIHKMDGHGTM